jgi:methylated-DNA-[protein]-cysteine S-methyltransferase
MPKNSSPSAFTSRVRDIVHKIPKGRTLTYKEVAVLAGNPNAARAVARIMAANYDPSIPCHRVVRSDGSLGGYNRGGTDAKRTILEREHHEASLVKAHS